MAKLARFLLYLSGTLHRCVRLNRGESDTWGGCWPEAPGGASGLFYFRYKRNKNAGTREDSFGTGGIRGNQRRVPDKPEFKFRSKNDTECQ